MSAKRQLPRVYVHELACDGRDGACKAAETIAAPNRGAALTEAYNRGWRRMIGNRLYCPACSATGVRL